MRGGNEKYFDSHKFTDPIYEKACRGAVTFRGHLSHPLGKTVHDASHSRRKPLMPGTVCSINPMTLLADEGGWTRAQFAGGALYAQNEHPDIAFKKEVLIYKGEDKA